MKLDDFLKCKKVKCVQAFGFHSTLTVGKVYDVKGLSERHVYICNDANNVIGYEFSLFKPVTDLPKSAENPLQDMKLTPEFEAVEPVLADNSVNTQDNGVNMQDNGADIKDKPKFKVGDKVYYGSEYRILTIAEFDDDGWIRPDRWVGFINNKQCCHATQENYERLQTTFPDIEFERPLTQADIDNEAVDKLAQAMKNKLAKKREKGYHGWETCKHGDLVQLLINHVDKGDPIDVANFCAFLFARGEQLTQGGTR